MDCPYNSGGYCDHHWADNDNAPSPDGWSCDELCATEEGCPVKGSCNLCGAQLTGYDVEAGECPRCNSGPASFEVSGW